MPHYDYRCADCGYEEEIFQKMTDLVLKVCPKCKKEAFQRLPGRGLGLLFRGSGFYETDYNSQCKEGKGPPSNGCCPCDK